jgi:hypothetical protein
MDRLNFHLLIDMWWFLNVGKWWLTLINYQMLGTRVPCHQKAKLGIRGRHLQFQRVSIWFRPRIFWWVVTWLDDFKVVGKHACKYMVYINHVYILYSILKLYYMYIYIYYIICIIQNVWERILLCLIGMISWWFNHDSTRSNKKIAWRQLVGRQGQQDFTGSIGRYLRAVGSTGKTTGPIKIPHGPWALWLPKNVLLPCNSPALPNHGIWMYFGFFQ